MAHVHGAKAATGAAKMTDSAMAGMGKMSGAMMHGAGQGAVAGFAYKYRKDILSTPEEE